MVSGPDEALWFSDGKHPAIVRMTIPPPAPTSGNLLRNPGFEVGAAPTAADAAAAIPGWVTTPNFTTLRYEDTFLPVPPGGGRQLAAGGPITRASRATQTIDLGGRSEYVDRGLAHARLSALLGGYASETDAARVVATFLSAAGGALSSTTIGPVTPADRGNTTKLLPRASSRPVPKGTRSIRVVVLASRSGGSYTDGYVDNVSLTLALGKLPAPVISHLELARSEFRAAESGPATRGANKEKTGTNVSYRTTLAGPSRFAVERPRKHGGFAAVGNFTRAAVAGANRLHFSGRVGGKRLPAGRYRLTLVPVNHEGRRGKALRASFTILP
jgi:hypothetical protein